MRFYNISVRPGDHAPFLETHGNSVSLGRSGLNPSFPTCLNDDTIRVLLTKRKAEKHKTAKNNMYGGNNWGRNEKVQTEVV